MIDQLPLAHIEDSVVDECARLIEDRVYRRPTKRFRLSAGQIEAIAMELGPRLTRLALRRAGFFPAWQADCDDWRSGSPAFSNSLIPVADLHIEDFALALKELDVDGRLRATLGLTHA